MLFLLESEVMTGVRCEASLPSHAPPLSPLVKHVSGPPVHLVPSPRVTKFYPSFSSGSSGQRFSWFKASKTSKTMMMNKKAFFANIEYSSLELATKKFIENNILEEGRVGHIYQSCFGVLAAVMILDGCGQDYDRMFDLLSLQILIRLCVQKSSERVEVS
ncbi:uncharacterized protein LOC110095545 isoform X2 [Dendrobium catenatum]|uniref:uncharacterized protein LOC110095545 isoform X2 n=1 Tax=Dendrobium catenatum TaxID=906689 RepID=UPI00109FBDF6|nr:uncharacterized protein LOC110095545 isoform X2 [Dendrobium catenatum]